VKKLWIGCESAQGNFGMSALDLKFKTKQDAQDVEDKTRDLVTPAQPPKSAFKTS